MLDVLQTHGAGVPTPVEQVGERTALGGCALEGVYCIDFECTDCPDAAAQRLVLTVVCAEARRDRALPPPCPITCAMAAHRAG